jgi:YD repeat-containing protein
MPLGQSRTIAYTYDALHRLTQEKVIAPRGSSAVTGQVNYTLDAVGNRTARTSTLPGVPNETQNHDANDRLTTVTDIYDFEDRLLRRTQADGTLIDLLYDAAGQRVAKSVTAHGTTTTTHYLLDVANPTGYTQVIQEHQTTAHSLTFPPPVLTASTPSTPMDSI